MYLMIKCQNDGIFFKVITVKLNLIFTFITHKSIYFVNSFKGIVGNSELLHQLYIVYILDLEFYDNY